MRRLVFSFLLLLFLTLFVPAHALRIAAASDLHIQRTSKDMALVNPLVPYNSELADALLYDVLHRSVDVLLLTGDITNQGREQEHAMLLAKLREAKAQGLRVFVLPGNHDIGDVTPSRFAEIYTEFGYGDAFSRDDTSLSYSMLVGDTLLLMLDTNGYDGNRTKAYLCDETRNWISRQLSAAKELRLHVLAAGHYPMLTSHTTTFEGREETIELLENADVPLYLCGHLHGRSVSRGNKLTELVIDQSISAPCSYAILDYGDEEITYRPQHIDVSLWATHAGVIDPNLLDFDNYASTQSALRWRMIVENLAAKGSFSEEEVNSAADFFAGMFAASAEGRLYLEAESLRESDGYAAFLRISDGTIYSRWVPTVLQNTVPYGTGFTLTSEGIR